MNENIESKINIQSEEIKQSKSSAFNRISQYIDKTILSIFGYSRRFDKNVSPNNVLVYSSFYRPEPEVNMKYVQGIDLRDTYKEDK